MGTINERLILTDGFSAAFRIFETTGNRILNLTTSMGREFTDLFNQHSTATVTAINNVGGALQTTNQLLTQANQNSYLLNQNLSRAMGQSAGAIIASIRELGTQTQQINQLLSQMASNQRVIIENQQRHTSEVQKTDRAANQLLSTVKRLVSMVGAASLIKAFFNMSDGIASTTARLNMLNDGMQTTNELNEMIYQSALRSRAAYDDTANAIAQMGINAENAFSSNQELIAFMEAVNKQFVIGGTQSAQMSNAMIQLTQAMASGALRGQDLNSILQAAPGIARNIERYMGWAAGSIKKHAEDGEVTAEVVKYAMLSLADEINEQFSSMPMTFSQAMTQIRSIVRHSLNDSARRWNDFINSADGQNVLGKMISLFSTLAEIGIMTLSAIGQGGLFVVNNLNYIIPVLLAIGLVFLLIKAEAIGSALASAAAWLAVMWPILLVGAGLAAAFIAAQQFGIGMTEVGMVVGQIFGMIYAVGYNVFASLWNLIASFAEFFANVFNDPVRAIVRLFTDVFDTILGIVETVAGAIDALMGSNLQSAVSGFRGKISKWVDETYGENAIQIKRMAMLDVSDTSSQWGNKGAEIGNKLQNMDFNLQDITSSFGGFNLGDIPTGDQLGNVGKVGSVGSVKNVEGEIKLSDEDAKLYRDLAERRYMNQIELKTLAPAITVNLPAGSAGNMKPDDVAEILKKMLIEQMGANTAISHG